MVCVILVEYKLCTHSCFLYTFCSLLGISYCCSVPGDVEDYIQDFVDF